MTVLQSRLEDYLRLRQSLGFKDAVTRHVLQDFVNHIEAKAQQGPIRAETALDWAREASSRCYRSGAAPRLRVVRGFLEHLKAFEPDTQVPPPGLVAEPRRPKAHLYSPEQILQMMEADGWFWKSGSFRQKTYRTIIGLLASTGLRIGEALRLALGQAHLDHDPPYLEIRDTKFHKSRLVPLHSTTAAKLREYLAERNQHVHSRVANTFFINDRGKPLRYSQVRKAVLQAQP